MMSLETESLADQIKRAYWGESWHGPSVREVLADVSAEDAAAHPIAGAHSIWEIVLHVTGGYRLVLSRVRGETVHLSDDAEWPTVPKVSGEAWRAIRETQDELNRELESAVRAFPVERLSEPLGSGFSAFTQFAGAPQHDLYHAGQIVMLKKALASKPGGSR